MTFPWWMTASAGIRGRKALEDRRLFGRRSSVVISDSRGRSHLRINTFSSIFCNVDWIVLRRWLIANPRLSQQHLAFARCRQWHNFAKIHPKSHLSVCSFVRICILRIAVSIVNSIMLTRFNFCFCLFPVIKAAPLHGRIPAKHAKELIY